MDDGIDLWALDEVHFQLPIPLISTLDSASCRHLGPIHVGTPIRRKSTGDSDSCRHGGTMDAATPDRSEATLVFTSW
jgi:hypothetical protein